MLKWLYGWNKYPIVEIENRQHLAQAQVQSPDYFMACQAFELPVVYPILLVVEEWVYWGKINGTTLRQRDFYKTNKQALEQGFLNASKAQQQGWNKLVRAMISQHYDQFDGQLIELKQLNLKTLNITTKNHYEWHYEVLVIAQSTGLNALARAETRHLEVVFSGKTLEELTVRELR
ncbi:MAG: hypothetical protein AB8E82_11820 [Aureispira sp.]